jgi:hypothetical protein
MEDDVSPDRPPSRRRRMATSVAAVPTVEASLQSFPPTRHLCGTARCDTVFAVFDCTLIGPTV